MNFIYYILLYRDVLNRSFLKIHEKNSPNLNQSQQQNQLQLQHEDVHSLSESECGNLEKYHHSNKTSKQNSTHHYAESLQDYDLSSQRMRRTSSGNSVTSSHAYFSEDGGPHVSQAKPVRITPAKVALSATISNDGDDDASPPTGQRQKINNER